MNKINTLMEVLEGELQDIYDSEQQIVQALPKMAKKASSDHLREAFQYHLEETKNQIVRLETVGTLLKINLTGKKCKAIEGLIEEGEDVLESESENPALIDCLLICAARRVEYYEIAAYGTARAIAEELDLGQVVSLLNETLDEEEGANEELIEISEREVLFAANGSGADEEIADAEIYEEDPEDTGRRA